MKRVLVIALLSSVALSTVKATMLEDCLKMSACPMVCALMKKMTEDKDKDCKRGPSTDNLVNYAASHLLDGSVQTLASRGLSYVTNQGLDSDVKDLAVDSVVNAGITIT